MAKGIFNPDNDIWRFTAKLVDLFLLSVFWLVCSIPLFTYRAGQPPPSTTRWCAASGGTGGTAGLCSSGRSGTTSRWGP